jgi:DNA-directed RNA polymerase subunit RPC12/RpoP
MDEHEIDGERRTCSACGKEYFLPIDGDPTRRCPHCNVLVADAEKADAVRRTAGAS